jgi:hypothetical protein
LSSWSMENAKSSAGKYNVQRIVTKERSGE